MDTITASVTVTEFGRVILTINGDDDTQKYSLPDGWTAAESKGCDWLAYRDGCDYGAMFLAVKGKGNSWRVKIDTGDRNTGYLTRCA